MSVARNITSATLQQLKLLYPSKSNSICASTILKNPWYIAASVAFSASNRPEGVTSVYKFVSDELNRQDASRGDHLLLLRRLKDAIFKAGLSSGYPKSINSLIALNEAAPEDLHDTVTLRQAVSRAPLLVSNTGNHRDTSTPIPTLEEDGSRLFQKIYGETAEPVQKLLDSIYPDLGWFSKTIGYGLVYGHTSVLTPVETSYVLVASIIAADTPLQINWHLAGARRQGASLQEVKAIRQIAMESAALAGVSWRDGVPEVV
ncbi:Peroxisomal Targeting Signal 1 Protein [Pleurotus pulmonarius]